MFRAGTSVLFASQQRAAAVAAAVTNTTTAKAATRRPANLAPTWFANQKKNSDSSANLKFIAISMRQVEVKSSDLLARPSDLLARPSDRLMMNSSSSSSSKTASCSPAPVSMEYDIDELQRIDHSNTLTRLQYINDLVSQSTTDTTFGDPSGGESLHGTAPIVLPGRRRSPWGKAFFGKIFHQPRNFAYQTSTYWSKKFTMKKHRYKKRWQKRRYKVAALANLPFAKRLRVNMIPKLQQGKKKKTGGEGILDLDFSPDAQDAAAAAATGKMKSGMKKRSRPKSKYQV